MKKTMVIKREKMTYDFRGMDRKYRRMLDKSIVEVHKQYIKDKERVARDIELSAKLDIIAEHGEGGLIERTAGGYISNLKIVNYAGRSETEKVIIKEINTLVGSIKNYEWYNYNKIGKLTGYKRNMHLISEKEQYIKGLGYIEDLIDLKRVTTDKNIYRYMLDEQGLLELYSLHVKAYNEIRISTYVTQDYRLDKRDRREKYGNRGKAEVETNFCNGNYEVKEIYKDYISMRVNTGGIDIIAILDKYTLDRYIKVEQDKIYDLKTKIYRVSISHLKTYFVDQGVTVMDVYGKPKRDRNGRIIKKTSLLHRTVVGATEGMQIHHINENRWDFRQRNLLEVTAKEHGFIGRHDNKELNEYFIFNKNYQDHTEQLDYDKVSGEYYRSKQA